MNASPARKDSLLQLIPSLAALSPAERNQMMEAMQVMELRRGDMLFREGDKPKGLYFLCQGLMKMTRITQDGKEMVLHLARPQHSIGEGTLFLQDHQNKAYSATATAAEDSTLFLIPTPVILALVRQNPDFALSMLSTLALRLYMYTRKLEANTIKEAPRRLALYLLHRNRLRGQENYITLDVSREILASMLGTARETLSRTLSKLTECGAIAVKGRTVHILHKEMLQRIANGDE